MNNGVYMSKSRKSWEGNFEGNVKDITFCVTEDCNLRCKYCYMVHKNSFKKMSYETAKKAVDYIIDSDISTSFSSVVWNFIGGEPLLEMELIDRISDYIKYKMFVSNHKCFDSYRFNFSTNGILYNTPKVQEYIEKNKGHLSMGISIDGNKEKHDLQRIYPDGRGSYDDVIKSVPLWQEQFPNTYTKATFSRGDLIYLKDSIISLWENGVNDVSANLVFEDVWEDGDDALFEQQLNELGDYILDNKLWDMYWVRFFEPSIGFKNTKSSLSKPVCGAGNMIAIDCDGNIYPCIRFLDFSLNKRKGLIVGNIEYGMDSDKLKPFKCVSLDNISDEECINCDVATGCAYCSGFNYDEYGTLYKRTKYNCKMHKANVRSNKRFWDKYAELTGEKSPREEYEKIEDLKFLQIMMSDDIKSTCLYDTKFDKNNVNCMSNELFKKAIQFAKDNKYKIVLLGEKKNNIDYDNYYANIVDASSEEINERSIPVYMNNCFDVITENKVCILIVDKGDIDKISENVEKLWNSNVRVNLILKCIEQLSCDDIEAYGLEIEKIGALLKKFNLEGKYREINIISDVINQNNKCDAGESTITLAPDGNFYICPAFYYDKIDYSIGNIEKGLDLNFINNICEDKLKLCLDCDSYQCKQCKYLNKKYTNEYSIPYGKQCNISKIEVIKQNNS